MLSMDAEPGGTLLYDSDCGVCVATARWLRNRVNGDRLRLVPIDEARGDPVAALVSGNQLRAALHYVRDDGTVFTGARAVVAAGRRVPGWRHVAGVVDHRVVYRFLEPMYAAIATHRRRISRALGLGRPAPSP
jgi:predicted DCC family thiol-disulfide oxidoreductase YuxK